MTMRFFVFGDFYFIQLYNSAKISLVEFVILLKVIKREKKIFYILL